MFFIEALLVQNLLGHKMASEWPDRNNSDFSLCQQRLPRGLLLYKRPWNAARGKTAEQVEEVASTKVDRLVLGTSAVIETHFRGEHWILF